MDRTFEGRRVFVARENPQHRLVVVDARETTEGPAKTPVIVARDVPSGRQVWLRDADFEEVFLEGRAYTREEALRRMLEKAEAYRKNGMGFWADQVLLAMKRFLSGEVVTVDTVTTGLGGGFEEELAYLSDGSVYRGVLSND